MNEREKNLREKLGLSSKDKLAYKQFQRATRNPNFIIEVNGEEKYFMKVDSEGKEKERLMYKFLSENNGVVNTVFPEYLDDRIMVFPFIKGLRDEQVKNHLEFMVNFHNASLELPKKTFERYLGDVSLTNHYIGRFVNRLERHEEMVKNFWEDIPSLVKFYTRTDYGEFEKIPKIFVHGDIQHKNLQKDGRGNVYLLDFEDIYYESPCWDLSRAIMDLESSEIDTYVQNYLSKINLDNKDLLLKKIQRDFVIRVVTDAIGRQQRFGVDGAKPYLSLYKERYTNKLEEIIYDKN